MGWLKVDDARRHAGGVSRQTLYNAVRTGKLRAARVGAGRNLLFCEAWIDEWLRAAAASDHDDPQQRGGR
jgi:excisionase family DNA binding protein